MRIAFYAPMKPPDHPVPSGDRRMARLLTQALERAGHEVDLASRLRSRDGIGDPARQERIARLGATLAGRLVRRYRALPPRLRPRAWLTYHLYYKAPDWIGPPVAEALGIPYLLAEASVADKRAVGPWALGHRATLAALDRARAVIALNPTDVDCLPDPGRVAVLKPFLDPAPYRAAAARRAAVRGALATKHGLDPARPWLLAAAMMRPGDKLASYRLLARAVDRLADLDWHLVIAGDGPARRDVEAAFARTPEARVRVLGERAPDELADVYGACDLFVWPALNEAYGMALLEAQAAGLPVVAGRGRGVAAVVRDGETGLLAPSGDAATFASQVRALLGEPDRRHAMAEAAWRTVLSEHGLERTARRLDAILHETAGP